MATTIFPYMDLNLHASDSHYAFTSPSNPTAPSLIVERPSGDLRLSESKLSGVKRVSSVSGILGLIRLRLDKYIVVVTKSRPVGKIRGATVFKVVNTELLPLRERALRDKDEDAYLALMRDALKSSPLYFSYQLDLTSSFQRQSRADPNAPLWQRTDDRFFWNKFISSDLIDFRSGNGGGVGLRSQGPQPAVDGFILPVIFGMLEMHKTSVKNSPFTFLLITRRSRHRTGTRYFSRGIDEQGHVSNFNETEQVIIINDPESGPTGSPNGTVKSGVRDVQILAYVQTRGSVPVYWAEVNKLKYTPEIQIRGIDSAVDPAKRHFAEQIETYGENYLVNLVNSSGRESRVKGAYEQLVRKLQTDPHDTKEKARSSEAVRIIESSVNNQVFDRLHYVYFDFHTETKGLRWHRAQLLLDELSEPLQRMHYFHGIYSPGDRTGRADVRNVQRGVVRTNCMDCLDRTNVIQSMLGRYALNRALQDLSLLGRGESAGDDAAFEFLFRNIWADNADIVSKSYSGTGALKTDFTRTGNRTRAGALQDLNNSITRYVRNNFLDGPRQDGFDLFSGAYLPGSSASLLFADRRPIPIQAIPYTLLASIFFVLVASVTPRLPNSTVWPLRLLVILFTIVAAYCGRFMVAHGTLFVNWPKLNTPPWAAEAYNEALAKTARDPLMGPLLKRHDGHAHTYAMPAGSGAGGLATGGLEEGKKRIE